jgi:hypothetical protein
MLTWAHKKDPAMKKKLPLLALALAAALAATPCRADLQDEIQVYDDSINQPREFGLELHVNTTPRGRGLPNYPGEVPPLHALRLTPEFSWGLTRTTELGLYLPTVRRPDGSYDLAGGKVRLKWLPLQPGDGTGAFGGVNFELSRLAFRYSESRTSLETRFIAGWRNPDWLVAVNPVLGFGLSPGFRGQRPDFDLGLKVSRRVGEGIAGGRGSLQRARRARPRAALAAAGQPCLPGAGCRPRSVGLQRGPGLRADASRGPVDRQGDLRAAGAAPVRPLAGRPGAQEKGGDPASPAGSPPRVFNDPPA